MAPERSYQGGDRRESGVGQRVGLVRDRSRGHVALRQSGSGYQPLEWRVAVDQPLTGHPYELPEHVGTFSPPPLTLPRTAGEGSTPFTLSDTAKKAEV